MGGRNPENPVSHNDPRFGKHPPITRFLLNKMDNLEEEMIQRYGADYSSIEAARHPDWLVKGAAYLTALIVIGVPELAVAHVKALAEGVYEIVKHPRSPKP